jgi:hypothetical protein
MPDSAGTRSAGRQLHPKNWAPSLRQAFFVLPFVVALLGASAVVYGTPWAASATKPQCNNRIDDDGDGKIDYPTDPGCTGRGDKSEVDPVEPPPPPPDGEPAPIAGQGYTVKFQDQFDSFNTAVWNPKNFWMDEEPGSVYVQGGILNIVNDSQGGYSESISAQTGPYWGGGQSKYDFTFGYAEARISFTGGKGSWPAFWLSSSAHAEYDNWPNCPEPDLNFELDIMEYQGDEPNTFYGTIHRNTGGRCGVQNSSRSVVKGMGFNPSGQWHTYAVLWTATQISFYVDEVPMGSVSPFDSSDQAMFLVLTMQACGWDATNDCDSSTPNELRTEVDWVKVWQK